MEQNRRIIHKLLEREAEVAPTTRINVDSPVASPEALTKILSRPSMMEWAGYSKLDDLEYLGQGYNGPAFRFRNHLVLKLTKDTSEAEASNSIKGRRLSNVNHIYKVAMVSSPFMRGETQYVNPREKDKYAILQEYLPTELTEVEAEALDLITEIMNMFVGEELGGNISMGPEGNIPWESPQTRGVFMKFLIRRSNGMLKKHTEMASAVEFLNSTEGKHMAAAIIRGLSALRRSGIVYADVHADNVRKSADGQYTLFDLGVSKVRNRDSMDILEHSAKHLPNGNPGVAKHK